MLKDVSHWQTLPHGLMSHSIRGVILIFFGLACQCQKTETELAKSITLTGCLDGVSLSEGYLERRTCVILRDAVFICTCCMTSEQIRSKNRSPLLWSSSLNAQHQIDNQGWVWMELWQTHKCLNPSLGVSGQRGEEEVLIKPSKGGCVFEGRTQIPEWGC